MKGYRSITRDIVQQKMQEKEYKKHQQRIQDIIQNKVNFKIDNQYDQQHQTNHFKSKILSNRFRFESDQQQINHDNSLLVHKITKIKENIKVPLQRSYLIDKSVNQSKIDHPHSLNYFLKKKQAIQIAQENTSIIKRLQNPNPVINSQKQIKDAQKYLQLKKQIQNYDFFPSPYKRQEVDDEQLKMMNIQQQIFELQDMENSNQSMIKEMEKTNQSSEFKGRKGQLNRKVKLFSQQQIIQQRKNPDIFVQPNHQSHSQSKNQQSINLQDKQENEKQQQNTQYYEDELFQEENQFQQTIDISDQNSVENNQSQTNNQEIQNQTIDISKIENQTSNQNIFIQQQQQDSQQQQQDQVQQQHQEQQQEQIQLVQQQYQQQMEVIA